MDVIVEGRFQARVIVVEEDLERFVLSRRILTSVVVITVSLFSMDTTYMLWRLSIGIISDMRDVEGTCDI